MRITKIRLKDFRGFRGEYCINLTASGKNLLIYGENGSGKSSLFQALNLFFSPATSFAEHRNIFVNTDDGYVKLEISDGHNSADIYEWEQTAHPFSEALIVEAAKTKGFLDYRALLETHYIHRQTEQINLFNLLINNLLANVVNPVDQTVFRERWRHIMEIVDSRRSPRRAERLEQQLPDFTAGLISVLGELTGKANELLMVFEQALTISLDVPDNGFVINNEDKSIDNAVVELSVIYQDTFVSRHHHFLNEARLSAIAISIYLGALLLNPPSRLRILFLDDVLIGLDMSNRLPLLDVLEKYFSDWQIVLTTYDRIWFDMVRLRVSGWKPAWIAEEFYCRRLPGEGDIPVHATEKDFLAAAQRHLDTDDLKAAAIYIRSAYEFEIERFCDRQNLPVRYCSNHKSQKSDDFWMALKNQKWERKEDGKPIDDPVVPESLQRRIELYRATVLNQLSHAVTVNLVHREVVEALVAVKDLRKELRKKEKLKRKEN